MQFQKHFPASVWVLRRATGRRARRIYFAVAGVILLATVTLHLHAAYTARRIRTLVGQLATIEIDHTTKKELLRTIPSLALPQPAKDWCKGECYLSSPYEFPARIKYRPSAITQSSVIYKIEYLLGLRVWRFSLWAQVQNGKVHNLGYHLTIDDGSMGYPDLINVEVKTFRGYGVNRMSLLDDESPDYRVVTIRKWPDHSLTVGFAPQVPDDLRRHSFDIRLTCAWTLRGCQAARDLLPDAWNDMQAIKAAAAARIQGPEPCPNQILSRRVRDIEDILLVKVDKIRPEVIPSVPADYVMADYCLVGALKGRVNRDLQCVMHRLTVYSPELGQSFPNPDLLLIKPGAVLLMFSDYSDPVDEPCEVIAATPDALQIIRTKLASPFPDIQEDDRWER